MVERGLSQRLHYPERIEGDSAEKPETVDKLKKQAGKREGRDAHSIVRHTFFILSSTYSLNIFDEKAILCLCGLGRV